jgi:ketosteroid isomerase-like protein
MAFASSRFRDGHVSEIETIASYTTSELATYLDAEHWHARVGDSELAEFDLRVTTTYRCEADGRRIVHRHADSISTPNPDGRLRDR